MPVHLHREIENLKQEIFTVGAIAKQSVREAARTIEHRDEALARSVIEKDNNLDQMEIEIEKSCLKNLRFYWTIDSQEFLALP